VNGQKVTEQGVYVYWFVDADRYTPQHAERMLWMARDVLVHRRTGPLGLHFVFFRVQFRPGGRPFERMKKLIAASVPEFQLVPGPKPAK
jgi:hypothetical protein